METVKGYVAKWNDFPQPKKMNILKGIAFACYALSLLLFVIFVFGRNGKQQTPKRNMIVFMHPISHNLYTLRYLAQRHNVHLAMIVIDTNKNTESQSDWNIQYVENYLSQLRTDGYSDKGDKGSIDENGVRLFSGVHKEKLQYTTYNNIYKNINRSYDANDNVKNGNLTKSELIRENKEATVLSSEPSFVSALDSYLSRHTAYFLVLGLCTDVAYYLNHTTASVHTKISEIFVAGGAFNVNGNAHYNYPSSNNKAELNFFTDAHAANFIVEGFHHIPVTILPLDATFEWNAENYQALIIDVLSEKKSNESTIIAVQSLRAYYDPLNLAIPFEAIKTTEEDQTRSKAVTLELLAAAYAADYNVQNRAKITEIAVSVTHDVSTNATGVSYRPANNPYNFNAKVVLQIQQKNFWKYLINMQNIPLA